MVARVGEVETAAQGLVRVLPGIDRGTAEAEIERLRQVEQAVAKDLRLHARGLASPVVDVRGIRAPRRLVRAEGRGLQAVGVGADDEAVQVLHAPAALDEFHGQPVQERLLGRRWRASSKVGDRFDERPAEVAQPDVVDRDPRGERIPWIDDPPGEGGAAAGARLRIGLAPRGVLFVRPLEQSNENIQGLSFMSLDVL